MKNIWILTKTTFREAIRRRIVATGLVLGVCFLIVYSVGFHFIYVSARSAEAALQSNSANQAVCTNCGYGGNKHFAVSGLVCGRISFHCDGCSISRRYVIRRDQFGNDPNDCHQAHSQNGNCAWQVVGLCFSSRIVFDIDGRRNSLERIYPSWVYSQPFDSGTLPHLFRSCINHDHLPCVFEHVLGISHGRNCIWFIRPSIHRRLDRTIRRDPSKPNGYQSWNYRQPDHTSANRFGEEPRSKCKRLSLAPWVCRHLERYPCPVF